jgi:membrane protease YdiL (CAAX protease family)
LLAAPLTLAAPLLLSVLVPSPLPEPGASGSHKQWLRAAAHNAHQALLVALEQYDRYRRDHPDDAVAALERCQLLGGADDDERGGEEEDEPEPLPDARACAEQLYRDFPASLEVALFHATRIWGSEHTEQLEALLRDRQIPWTDAARAQVWAHLSQIWNVEHKPQHAGLYARRAMALDPARDLTLTAADALFRQGRRAEGLAELSVRAADGPAYQVLQKARALADQGAFLRARWLLDLLAERKEPVSVEPLLEARVLEGTGENARALAAYQALPAGAKWDRPAVVRRLFLAALEGDDAAGAEKLWRELRSRGPAADPLGHERLRLAWCFPRLRWEAADFAGLAGLGLLLLTLALLPLLWIAPVHYWSLWRRLRAGAAAAPSLPNPGSWLYRHVWAAHALFLLAQFIAVYLFAYEGMRALLLGDGQPDFPDWALTGFLLGCELLVGVVLLVLLVRRPARLGLLGPGSWSIRRCLGRALLTTLLGMAVAAAVVKLAAGAAASGLSNELAIRACIGQLGLLPTLLLVAVLVPLVEELCFRSVTLDVFAREIPFWAANLIQAGLFSAAHGDLRRAPFYLALGLLYGKLRRDSGGLLPSVLAHGLNNGLVTLALAATPGAAPAWTPPAPVEAAPALVACMERVDPRWHAPANGLSPTLLNAAAWTLAKDREERPDCLDVALEAVDQALEKAHPLQQPAFLDTKATLLFRVHRLRLSAFERGGKLPAAEASVGFAIDEAVDLERAAATAASPFHFSQLDRFFRFLDPTGQRQLQLGPSPAELRVSEGLQRPDGQREVRLELVSPFPNGLVVFLRPSATSGLLRVEIGAGHESLYRLPVPRGLGPEETLVPTFVDSRGCESCAPGQWRWRWAQHDPAVDALP